MIYELRTSTVKQRSLAEVVKAAGMSLDVRKDNYGKLEGCWQTEIGPLNQVMELWGLSRSQPASTTSSRAEHGPALER
jgi:NIPSNAP